MLVVDEMTETVPTEGRIIGQVKWWNDQMGYGFATVVDAPEDSSPEEELRAASQPGCDVFVHHTSIAAQDVNYRSLIQGEYIEFNIARSQSGVQATHVTGVKRGTILCQQRSWKRGMSVAEFTATSAAAAAAAAITQQCGQTAMAAAALAIGGRGGGKARTVWRLNSSSIASSSSRWSSGSLQDSPAITVAGRRSMDSQCPR
jgi:cold shock CspA family protein